MSKSATLLFILLFLALPNLARAQFTSEANHPELSWKVLETAHFEIYYAQGLAAFAGRVARAAEAAYGPVTRFYNFQPDGRVNIILRDTDDYANGEAYYYHNTIEIWATNLEFELRGTTDWVRNVVTHEFTHIVSLQTARKASRRIPAIYLHYFGYQAEKRREDILTGYPDILASYAIPLTIVPPWFAEGTAQYQADGSRHDHWDTHRDMILRMATLNNRLLTHDEMDAFGDKTSLGYEKVYDHGFSLVLYIANTFGEDKLPAIFRAMATWWQTDFDAAIHEVLGISGRELHRRWVASLKERYRVEKAQIGPHLAEGKTVSSDGYYNFYPHWSPDGKKLGYISNKGGDYGRTSLFVLTLADSTTKMVAPGATTAFDWSADGKHILFTRFAPPNRYGSHLWDLYTVDLSTPAKEDFLQTVRDVVGLGGGLRSNEKRLSVGLRASHPTYAPDGTRIAFVKNGGGSSNLEVMDVATGHIRALTHFNDGSQVYTPAWSPDGRQIAFSIFRRTGARNIAVIPAAGGAWTDVVASAGTDRDPCWSPDGKDLVFSSDQDGVFNLYRITLDDGSVFRITRVLGGAFEPNINRQDGRIAFAYYGVNGYEIRTIDGKGLNEPVPSQIFRPTPSPELAVKTAPNPVVATRPYRNKFASFSIVPRVAIDDNKLKLGFYGTSDGLLGKQDLFLGGMIAPTNHDVDLFGTYEFRRLRPTLFFEAYRQSRHVSQQIVNRDEDYRIYHRTFTLNELDLGVKSRTHRGNHLDARLIYSRYAVTLDQARFNGLNRVTLGATYLNGFDMAFTYQHSSVPPAIDSDINPHSGREITFHYDRFFNYFLNGFKQNSSILIELYEHDFYDQFSLDWNEYVPLGPGRNTLGLRFYGGFIDHSVDSFFDFHTGGLPYLKGYTYYSLEGRRTALFSADYRFPLWTHIDRQTGPLCSEQIYGSVYAGMGRAWDGDAMDSVLKRGWKRDVGAQIRYDATSFYSLPTRVSLDVAYGFDSVPLLKPGDPAIRSGPKIYFTLLFGYLESVGNKR